jgi:cytochrome d ubiquinol oxidase subunit II
VTLPEVVIGLTWVGVTFYVLFAGADFGAGIWDLFAGRTEPGTPRRKLIEHAIGPIWEANHVWLIFVLVVLWTGFPQVFVSVMSTLIVPLTLAAVGIIGRGSAFAFRKEVIELDLRRTFGATFAASSLLTPFFLGTIAGAVASGRVPMGNAEGDLIRSWVNPTSALGGTLAALSCAYLAAVYLTRDAERDGDPELVAWFRRRALVTGVVIGAVALGGIAVLRADAPVLFEGLTGRALPVVVLSAIGGVGSLAALATRHFVVARVAAAAAVTAVVWGWALAQYPQMLVGGIDIETAASGDATLTAMLVSLAVGGVLVAPSLIALFVVFQRSEGIGH